MKKKNINYDIWMEESRRRKRRNYGNDVYFIIKLIIQLKNCCYIHDLPLLIKQSTLTS